MNARSILFASLGGMLLLVIALLFVVDGNDDEAAARPAPSGPSGAAAVAPAQPAGAPAGAAGADSAGVADPVAAPAAERPTQEAGEGAGHGGGGAAAGGERAGRTGGEPAAGSRGVADGVAAGAAGGEADGGAGAAEPQETVEEVLRATARRYEGIRSLRADFEQRLTNTLLGRTTASAGTLYQRQPDRFLMDFSDPEGDVIVSDGEYFWLYYPSADPKQVIRSQRGAGGLDLRSQFVGDPVRRFEATSHGRETVRGRETHVITLEPREAVGYRRLKVWIDAGDHLVRRFELTEDNGNIRRFELTDVRVNPSLPDDLFRFEPPAGAVVVTR